MTSSRVILSAFIISIFLFLRFYKIQDSLFFFNDMGRDMLVLYNWQQTGRPPLLGPQTSALPLNQSPLYFYYLYPFYLLTGASPYTALIANAFLYISSFIFGLYLFRKSRITVNGLLITFFLISIHPQYIIQSRSVWNPSLITPLIIASILALFQERLILFSLFIGLAFSLSYSVFPLILAVIIYYLIFIRQKTFRFISLLSLFTLITNLTLFAQITKNLFSTRHLFNYQQTNQTGQGIDGKVQSLKNYVFQIP